tara:strand:- start:174 stop:1127 length:954 start_codon:yes stop_codon:yes gene_type:complete
MTIKVGIIAKDPFIINDHKLSGFTIDIWEHIANKKKIKFKYYTIKNRDYNKMLDKYHVVLGNIPITPENVRKIDFTTPYYFSNYAVVSKKKNNSEAIISSVAKLLFLLFTYVITSMTIYYFLQTKDVKINQVIYYTIKNMSPYLVGKRDTDLLARFNYLFSLLFIILVIINIYSILTTKDITTSLPKKPILVDDANKNLIKYLKSRGAQVKVVKNTGGFNKLLDLYLADPNELSGVFVSEESKIDKNGIIFNNNPKYQNLSFKRYNFGKSQMTIAVRKNHPMYQIINSELLKMKENGKLFELSKNWLNYKHSKQLHI